MPSTSPGSKGDPRNPGSCWKSHVAKHKVQQALVKWPEASACGPGSRTPSSRRGPGAARGTLVAWTHPQGGAKDFLAVGLPLPVKACLARDSAHQRGEQSPGMGDAALRVWVTSKRKRELPSRFVWLGAEGRTGLTHYGSCWGLSKRAQELSYVLASPWPMLWVPVLPSAAGGVASERLGTGQADGSLVAIPGSDGPRQAPGRQSSAPKGLSVVLGPGCLGASGVCTGAVQGPSSAPWLRATCAALHVPPSVCPEGGQGGGRTSHQGCGEGQGCRARQRMGSGLEGQGRKAPPGRAPALPRCQPPG